MLSLFQSLLGMWETIFEPMGVNFRHMEVGLWLVNGEFEHFLNFRHLGVDF